MVKTGWCAFDGTGYSEQVWADLATHWNKMCGLWILERKFFSLRSSIPHLLPSVSSIYLTYGRRYFNWKRFVNGNILNLYVGIIVSLW